MGTNYPGGLDSLSNPSSGDGLASPSHAAQHADANDAIEAIETELGTNPRGSAASVKARLDGIENGSRITLVDGSVTPAKLSRPIGNLLTDNQASGGDALGNTDGFAAAQGGTISYTGGRIVVTDTDASATTSCDVYLNPQVAVTAGDTITVYAEVERITATQTSAVLYFWDISQTLTGPVVPILYDSTANGIRIGQVTTQVPAGAVWSGISAYGLSPAGSTGATHVVHRMGIWKGAGGLWQMPGVPIPNTGIRTNPANSAQVQVWNDATATWITV